LPPPVFYDYNLNVDTTNTIGNAYFRSRLTFNNASNLNIDFGDGSPIVNFNNVTSVSVNHFYSASGVYNVMISMSDRLALTGATTMLAYNMFYSQGSSISSLGSFSEFPNVTSIDISNNNLETIDQVLPENLITLSATSNIISSITSTLPNSLLTLNLEDNDFSDFNVVLPPNLQTLKLFGNVLSAFTSTIPSTIHDFEIEGNLTEANVDAIVAELDSFGTSNGILGLNTILPSAAGLISLQNLVNRGWTEVSGTLH
jgi:Leucine-rich repeat (LRR) protein